MTARADPFPLDEELSEEEVAKTRRLLGLTADLSRNDSADSSTCSHPRKRKRPDSGLVMPKVPELALDADRHWSGRIHGLHPTGHLLGFRGLYVMLSEPPADPSIVPLAASAGTSPTNHTAGS